MKLSIPTIALALAAGFPLAASAQTSAPAASVVSPDSPEVHQARDAAKTASFAALSDASRAKVQAVIDQVNGGKLTDLRSAVRQIDGALTPAESKAVMAERAKLQQAMHVDPGAPTVGDAGRFLFNLSVSRDKLRELRRQETEKTAS